MKRFSPADAAAPGLPGARPCVRVTLLTLLAAAALAALTLFAYALAAARVPQHRATLESLVRAETGLDVRFSELTVRWGWYGPEAVFHDVELREPGETTLLLRAPQLVAGVDLWRILRSGSPALGRITLVNPDIDLTHPFAVPAARGGPGGAPRDPRRLLAGWHGTRIDVEGGTLRAAPAGVPLAAGIRRFELRRSGSDWSAAGSLTLPESLGATVQAQARVHAAAEDASDLVGTVTLSASHLELAGWHALLAAAAGAAYLPAAGRGDASVQIELAHGTVAGTHGSLDATGLAWPATAVAAGEFALERLRADWDLARSDSGWLLSVKPRAALEAHLAGLTLGATVSASFDWNPTRGPAQSLRTDAQLRDLRVTAPGGTHTLAGLTARLTGSGSHLTADIRAASAHLTVKADPAFASEALGVRAQLELEDGGRAWRVSTGDAEVRAGEARLLLRATLTGEDDGARPRVDAQATLTRASVGQLRDLIGAPALAALGTAAGALTAGRIERAELVARGPLDQPLPWRAARQEFRGSLELTGATLAGSADWPQLHGLDAHLEWQGAHVRARVEGAGIEGLRLTVARGEWDESDATLTHLTGRLDGRAEEALAWLRDHPQLGANVPGLGDLGISGGALVAFDVRRVPGARAAAAPRYLTRLTALLDGAQLRPVAGLPGIEALHGTLALSDGHLQRSTVTGQWLGGPIALNVGERREHGAVVLTLAARGLLDVREAVAAAGGLGAEDGTLAGNAAWSADLRVLPAGPGTPASWRLRADSSLVGVMSSLPEPFAKSAGTSLPLHLELQGGDAAGEIKVALGERLHAVGALARRGELWQIERGGVHLGAGAATLPAAAQVRVEGSLEQLDLAAYAALWRELAASPAWPALSVELAAGELRAGARSFADVRIAADTGAGVDQLRLQSADLDALVRIPPLIDAAHPVTAHLERLDLAQLDPGGVGAAVAAALGPALELSIADLEWQGRSLGALTARLTAEAGTLSVHELRVSGSGDEAHGTLECGAELCRADFSLETRAAAATLARLGLRTDLDASHAALTGQLTWPAAGVPSLASASGRVHLELVDGLTRGTARASTPAVPLGLLAVPALVAAMGLPELHFARLSADFTVGEGQAVTRNLHLDGDTEILMQGRIGLVARDYDARVWVLKGEERLPAAVRGLSPGPRVAALWMSLRDFFGGAERERAALRLHGTWDDPMVTQP